MRFVFWDGEEIKEGAREPKLPRALTYILLLLLLRSSCFSSPDACYYLSSVFPTFSGQLIIVLCHFSQDACPIVIFLTQATYP